jgi:hypothetical protein
MKPFCVSEKNRLSEPQRQTQVTASSHLFWPVRSVQRQGRKYIFTFHEVWLYFSNNHARIWLTDYEDPTTIERQAISTSQTMLTVVSNPHLSLGQSSDQGTDVDDSIFDCSYSYRNLFSSRERKSKKTSRTHWQCQATLRKGSQAVYGRLQPEDRTTSTLLPRPHTARLFPLRFRQDLYESRLRPFPKKRLFIYPLPSLSKRFASSTAILNAV